MNFIKSSAIAAAITFTASSSAMAGTIDLSNLTTFGNASVSNDVLTLTPDLYSQAGFAFDNTQHSGISDFTASFEFYLGNNNGGADGITFAWIENPLGATLPSGGGLGYSSDLGGYAVEFDTWFNGGYDSTSLDHVAIDQGSSANSLTTTGVANLENGAWHSTDITFSNGNISVNLNGSTVIDNYTIAGYTAFDGYFGFTGATGAAKNLQQVRNFTMGSESIISAVPEPSTYALMLGGLGLVGFMAARRRKKA